MPKSLRVWCLLLCFMLCAAGFAMAEKEGYVPMYHAPLGPEKDIYIEPPDLQIPNHKDFAQPRHEFQRGAPERLKVLLETFTEKRAWGFPETAKALLGAEAAAALIEYMIVQDGPVTTVVRIIPDPVGAGDPGDPFRFADVAALEAVWAASAFVPQPGDFIVLEDTGTRYLLAHRDEERIFFREVGSTNTLTIPPL